MDHISMEMNVFTDQVNYSNQVLSHWDDDCEPFANG